MNKQKKAKVIAMRSFIAALSLVIGLLVSAQWRSIPTRTANPIAPYMSLKDTKQSLYNEQGQLKNEIKNLKQSIRVAQEEIANINLSEDQLSELNQKKAQAGLTALNGRGVIITYDDSNSKNVTEDSIVHAADLRDTVNLLWSSGAEAITINSQRIVINTAIDCIGNTILVNNTHISNPFRIEAIGNQAQMLEHINSSRYLTDIHRRKTEVGLIFYVVKNNDITTPAFDGRYETKAGGNL